MVAGMQLYQLADIIIEYYFSVHLIPTKPLYLSDSLFESHKQIKWLLGLKKKIFNGMIVATLSKWNEIVLPRSLWSSRNPGDLGNYRWAR
jgi:hypothetical protein